MIIQAATDRDGHEPRRYTAAYHFSGAATTMTVIAIFIHDSTYNTRTKEIYKVASIIKGLNL